MEKNIWNNKKFWILLFTLGYTIVFGVNYTLQKNYEFIGYAVMVLVLTGIVYLLNRKYYFSDGVLFGLSIWGILHMLGGTLKVGSDVLYKLILLPIYQNPDIAEFVIFKFDQFAHLYFYFFATIFCFYLLKPYLKDKYSKKMVYFLLIMIGAGIGAMNEIIEFAIVLAVQNTGVGGYYNTMMDIIFNTLGSIAAVIYLKIKGK